MTSHRGSHPEDDDLFAPSELATLRAAVHDLSWLRTRGYGDNASLKLVGDHYRLRRRQRNAVARSACSDAQKTGRLERRVLLRDLRGEWLAVDGFNVIITVEGALGGAYSFIGRDRAYRDVDPIRGTYRLVEETTPAVRAVRDKANSQGLAGITWWLDSHVANVGRLKAVLQESSPQSMGWRISVEETVDQKLLESDHPVASSDSEVLDHVRRWCSLEEAVFPHLSVDPHVRDLRPPNDVE